MCYITYQPHNMNIPNNIIRYGGHYMHRHSCLNNIHRNFIHMMPPNQIKMQIVLQWHVVIWTCIISHCLVYRITKLQYSMVEILRFHSSIIVTQLLNLALVELKGSLPHSHKPPLRTSPEPNKSSMQTPTLIL